MAWATPMFDHTKASQDYVPSRSLDEASVAYSIANRNNIIFKPKPTTNININNSTF